MAGGCRVELAAASQSSRSAAPALPPTRWSWRAARARGAAAPGCRPDVSTPAIAPAARELADRQPPRRLRPPRARAAVRRRRRHAGAVGVRPHRQLRPGATVSTWRCRCRRPTRSWAPPRSELRDALPAGAGRAAAGRARARGADVLRHPRARRDVPRRPGRTGLRPGPRTALPGLVLAGAWTDTGWPATMEGAVRSGHAAAARRR